MRIALFRDRGDKQRMLVKKLFFLIGDAFLLALSICAAYWLRFEGHVHPSLGSEILIVATTGVTLKLAVFFAQRLHMLSWSQVGLEDMVAVVRTVSVATLVFWGATVALRAAWPWLAIPRSVLLIDYVLTLNMIAAFRIGRRVQLYLNHSSAAGGRLALIAGAGAAGEQLALSLRNTANSGYTPIGFIDDDRTKLGTTIRGLRVLGGRAQLLDLVRMYRVQAILIAMPSAPSDAIRNVVSLARQGDVREIRIVPSLDRMLNGRTSFHNLREIELSDLLGRPEVRLDAAAIEKWLHGRTVLVTGAGGSIGSELCRQMTRFCPRQIVVLDNDETALFWIERDLQRLKQRSLACLEDIRDPGRITAIMRRLRPDVVFHVAAYKHVDLMERHPDQAVNTNVLGALTVAQAAQDAKVEKFVLISTDKAVNPTSVMGATKRVAEQVCLALNDREVTQYMVVRFGNVLGSRGSVVPLFQDNIRRGDAITIRGREMRRYFMATSEAVLMVLEAGAIGHGGEVFVLDMGEPIRIHDLACDLIRLSGLEPDRDVPIIFADPLPGEKEHEDLLTAEEGITATRHEGLLVARPAPPADAEALLEQVEALREMAKRRDRDGIARALTELVPTYQRSSAVDETQIVVVGKAPEELPRASQPEHPSALARNELAVPVITLTIAGPSKVEPS